MWEWSTTPEKGYRVEHKDMRLEVSTRCQVISMMMEESSCALDSWAGERLVMDQRDQERLRTGGSALPRGIGCGATGAAGAVSAQNQPIVRYVSIRVLIKRMGE